MPLLSNLCVNNFRTYIDGEFPLASLSPIIGYNNGGKSNLLKACSWLFNKEPLKESDFNNTAQPIVELEQFPKSIRKFLTI